MTERTARVDWLSFSYPSPVTDEPGEGWFNDVIDHLEHMSDIAYLLLYQETSAFDNGRRPYALSFGNRLAKVFVSPSVEWSLCEITGAGCAELTRNNLMSDTAAQVARRCTRLDIAVDINVGEENRVREFVKAGYSNRFKTKSWVQSSTGVTHYIGSRTSERMCRVYQYAPPHPRAEIMRVEFELKGDRAKQAADMLRTGTVEAMAQGLIDAYGFKSPLIGTAWGYGEEFEPLRGKQRHNNTIAWIHKQVVPAINKLVEEGVIEDLEKFVMDTFINGSS